MVTEALDRGLGDQVCDRDVMKVVVAMPYFGM